jgi:TRAP transporter TAXI family solute receptor
MSISKRMRCLAGVAIGVVAGAALAQAPTAVVLGTATPGGGFPVYGAAFAATVNEFDATLKVEPRNTRGSAENIPLLEAGKLDIGLVQGEAAHEAINGIGRAPANLRIIAAMYSSPGMFVVRADSPARTIRDLVGKPVAFGAKGSGLVILSRYVLDGIGLDQDKDFGAVYLERAGDGPAMALDGRVAALWGGGIGWPGFDTMAKSPGGARFIAPDAGEIARILAKHPFLKPLSVPANTYPGQPAPIQSVGSWSFVLAPPSLPDDVAYRLIRAIHKGEAALAKRLPAAAETTAANTLAAAPRPELVHPGVMKYLREANISR